VVIGQRSLQRFETDLLENDVAVGVCKNFFVNAIASAVFGIDQFIAGNARFKRPVFKGAVALLFREKITAIGNDESHVSGASLINAGKINFVEDAVTDRKPDFAVLIEGRTHPTLGARGPTWRNAGPARRIACGRVSHAGFVLGLKNVFEQIVATRTVAKRMVAKRTSAQRLQERARAFAAGIIKWIAALGRPNCN
jgi:hypothetical protein